MRTSTAVIQPGARMKYVAACEFPVVSTITRGHFTVSVTKRSGLVANCFTPPLSVYASPLAKCELKPLVAVGLTGSLSDRDVMRLGKHR